MPFSEFIAVLLQALSHEGVRPCVLRNYQGFPARNIGNDIDLLIAPSDLPNAVRAIRSIEGIRIVGYAERPYVANVFLEGISRDTNSRALEIDFDMRMSWKGLPPFLSTEEVLEAAIPYPTGNPTFFVPSPVHEAIISLLMSLFAGGWLKEKYFPAVQKTFTDERSEVIAALLPKFGREATTHLVDSVIDGDRGKVLECVRPLRIALFMRSMSRRPIRSLIAVGCHYANEFSFRYSPNTLESVSILGLDDSGKSRIAEALIPRLQSMAAHVESRTLRRQLPLESQSLAATMNLGSHIKEPSGSLVSMANAVRWLMREWLNRFSEKKNLTLAVREEGCHDLLVYPLRSRYNGPKWFTRLVGRLLPHSILCILLDRSVEEPQSNDQQNCSSVRPTQLEAFLSFVKPERSYAILDASKPVANIVDDAYAAIVDALAQRTAIMLTKRFL
jgi:hypothetical protein